MTQTDDQPEIERLRARIVALEAELVEVQSRANAAVAAAQDKAYWLERWHVDLNKLMTKPGAAQFRWLLRAVRTCMRVLRRLKRKQFS